MANAAQALAKKYHASILLKGGHLRGDNAIDLLFHQGESREFSAPFVRGVETHGTGCTYSAAITAGLASGSSLEQAIARAKVEIAQRGLAAIVVQNYYGNYRRGSFNQANIVHNTNITNIYRNASVRNGVSGVSASNFGRGGINTRNFVRPTSGDLTRAGVVRGQVGLAPTRDSSRVSDRTANTAGMPRSNYTGSFVSRNGATGGQQRLGGSGLVNGSGNRVAPVNNGSAPVNRGSGSGNWQRFNPSQGGQSRGGQNIAPSTAPQQRGGSQGGWQRFDPNQQRGQSPSQSQPRGRSFEGGSVNRPSNPSGPQMRNDPPARTYAPPTRNDSPGGSMSRPSNRDGGQQPVRISPPMVRSNPGGGGGGGNYNRPAPSQAPSQAPRAAPAAPRSAPPQRSAPAPRNDHGGNQGNGGGQGRRNH
jgi:hypothetical protein